MARPRQYYMGEPSLDHMPFRIGEGFVEEHIMDARATGARILRENGRDAGWLCVIVRGRVRAECSVRADDMWSQYTILEGRLPTNPGPKQRWDWRRISKY